MCASATPSRYEAVDATHTHLAFACTMHARIYVHAYVYKEERIRDACRRTIRAHVCVLVCARASACASAHVYPLRTARALSAGVDRVRFGSQAFQSATSFSANIGAWNIASLTSLYQVCARSVGARCGAALVATAPPMCARLCAHVSICTRCRGCRRVYA